MIKSEFFQQRMVRFCGDQLVDHIHGGGKQNLETGLCGIISDALCQLGLSYPRMPDQDDVLFLMDKLRVRQVF